MLANKLSRRGWLILAITASSLVIMSLYLLVSHNSKDDSSQTTSSPQEFVSSMEGGSPITQEDEEMLEKQVDFSVDQAKSLLVAEYPNVQSILLRSTEWYYTDTNDNSNILTIFSVAKGDGSVITVMRVIEFVTEEGQLKMISHYEPDERYSIYE